MINEGCGRKRLYCPGICMEGLEKNHKNPEVG
jgi:hypothetical protein